MENNVKIAEFMGAVVKYGCSYELYGILPFIDDGEWEVHFFEPEDMLFDSSWDWLMPVVQKIFTLKFSEVNGLRQYTERFNTIFDEIDCHLASDIEHIHQRVVEFIDWYETTKK